MSTYKIVTSAFGEPGGPARSHYLVRTSSEGGPFIGRCPMCGTENLPASAAKLPCPNPQGFTLEDVLEAALLGESIVKSLR